MDSQHKPNSQVFLRITALALASMAILLWHSPLIFGQADTGSVSGTVKDQTGAVIPTARVTLTNEGTNISRSVDTDTSGFYVFSPLRVGSYTVSASKTGFNTVEQRSVTVNIQQNSVVPFTLNPGTVTQTIQVT